MHFSVGAYSYKLRLSPPSFVSGEALWKQVTVKALPSETVHHGDSSVSALLRTSLLLFTSQRIHTWVE